MMRVCTTVSMQDEIYDEAWGYVAPRTPKRRGLRLLVGEEGLIGVEGLAVETDEAHRADLG